jgi:hypothetical protein
MSNPNVKPEAGSSNFSALFASILIPVAILVGILVFMFILGNPSNFEITTLTATLILVITWA